MVKNWPFMTTNTWQLTYGSLLWSSQYKVKKISTTKCKIIDLGFSVSFLSVSINFSSSFVDVFIRGDFSCLKLWLKISIRQTNQRITCNLRFSNWEVMYQKKNHKIDFDMIFFYRTISSKYFSHFFLDSIIRSFQIFLEKKNSKNSNF